MRIYRARGLDETDPPPGIELKASGGDVTVPLLNQEETGVDLIFLGTLKKGQTLKLRHERPPLLDAHAPLPAKCGIAGEPSRIRASAAIREIW